MTQPSGPLIDSKKPQNVDHVLTIQDVHIYAGELVLVPIFSLFKSQKQYHLKKAFLQQPQANQELETGPLER